ncbi:MAG: dihydroorotate dehydrogenase [Clostridiales Family XIII bacterium]|jgi:dihydroorotate dehydrogenase (NAD+) catalytic subunit|nr:dihydroorotate dehydrogenase [Clostridiales Family XIII bacterium]
MIDMRVDICGVKWKNPVAAAAGTFVAAESGKYYDPNLPGAVTTKGVSLAPWPGNPTPRVAETYGGMLNAVGLENPGVDAYISGELKYLKERGVTVIANVAGHSADEYCAVVRKLSETDVDMLELNVSCPNVAAGGMAFGVDRNAVGELTGRVRKLTDKPVIVKLSPNVTDICDIAAAAEDAGADAVSLINTLVGMRIDIRSGKPVLANVTGGLSGPAVKPVAVAMVYRVAKRVRIPVIGMGGIMTGADAMEFLLAGASAVEVGTAALLDPNALPRIIEELDVCVAGRSAAQIHGSKTGWG